MKKTICLALCFAMLFGAALAEAYSGKTCARDYTCVAPGANGTLASLNVTVGETVHAGDVVAALQTEKVFATEDGVVLRVCAAEGDSVSGDAVLVNPVSLYEIYATVEEAYASVASNLVHVGETVWISCTYDGTHRALGRVTQLDGNDYRVETTGGELYVGETVNLYRDAAFSYKQRVGVGTVVGSDPIRYTANGKIVRMCVQEGDYVERGQLIYETIADGEAAIVVETDGVVSEIAAQAGAEVRRDEELMRIVRPEDVQICLQVDENALAELELGQEVEVAYACAEEKVCAATVAWISFTAENGLYTVWIAPETPPEYIGMDVIVRTGEHG